MSEKKDMNYFNNLVAKIAADLMLQLKEEFPKLKWKTAFLDARAVPTGEVGCDKFRMMLPRGGKKGMSPSMAVSRMLFELWDLRDELFSEKWYGLKLTFDPKGGFETEFNYDPKCFDDPDYYDIE